jgi:ParB family transcriptional regulator, chromosome partitioning protein
MPIKLSDALQRVKAGIADLDESNISPSFEISPPTSPTKTFLQLREIVVSDDRIRRYFDSEKTASLAHSIQRYGFRGVLWVRLVKGQYYLVAGGRRYAACQQAGVQEVPVEIWDITDAEAIQLELLENFQREDLNPIEETEGILRMLEVTLNISRADVVALLNWKARQQREKSGVHADNVIRLNDNTNGSNGSQATEQLNSERWQVIEEVFKVIGKFNPESFRTNRLPLLNLPQPILDAISTGKIEYTKARLIARIKDEEIREELLAQAIEESLSYGEITTLVQQTQSTTEDFKSRTRIEQQEFRSRANSLIKRLRSTKLSGRTLKKAEKLLGELEALLNEE